MFRLQFCGLVRTHLMEDDRDVAAVRMRGSLPALKASLLEHDCLPMSHACQERCGDQWSIKTCSQKICNPSTYSTKQGNDGAEVVSGLLGPLFCAALG
jgi:hypothetical protein